MRQIKDVKSWVTAYDEIVKSNDDLGVLYEFAKEGEATEEEVDKQYADVIKMVEELEFRNMLHDEADSMSCVLKINAGAGGTESQDWADMLMRMYMRYAEAHNYKVRISNILEGDDAGIKSCTMEIDGDYAYGYLKGENGVHRLVRVSPFNAQGKRMTSFSSVFVTPLIDDTIDSKLSTFLKSLRQPLVQIDKKASCVVECSYHHGVFLEFVELGFHGFLCTLDSVAFHFDELVYYLEVAHVAFCEHPIAFSAFTRA